MFSLTNEHVNKKNDQTTPRAVSLVSVELGRGSYRPLRAPYAPPLHGALLPLRDAPPRSPTTSTGALARFRRRDKDAVPP